MLPMIYTIIVNIFVLFFLSFLCNFVFFFLHFFFCFKLRNDFNLLFVACHNNRSFSTTKQIDEHGISAKKRKQQGKNQVLIYYCENLNVYSIPASEQERTTTM